MKKIIFSDFDGTLTDGDQLGAIFFSILELITKNKMELVIVSGRSLSWGHFLLTHFPIKAAIMEGGGSMVVRDQHHQLINEYLVDKKVQDELEILTKQLLVRFPSVSLTADTLGRKVDRAIEKNLFDSSQNGKKMQLEIEQFLSENNAFFSYSSIHLNFWCGNFSKYQGMKHFISKYRPGYSLENSLYFGDAPNDQEVFRYHSRSIGVSNIKNYLKEMKYLPQIILEGKENRGPYGVFNYLSSELK